MICKCDGKFVYKKYENTVLYYNYSGCVYGDKYKECTICGKDANLTQRLVNNKPAKYEDPDIVVGGAEGYQARCRSCHEIDRRPDFGCKQYNQEEV